MGIQHPVELEGQISINELLDKPIGTEPIQLALPIHFHIPQASRPSAAAVPPARLTGAVAQA